MSDDVIFLLFDGFAAMDAVGPADVFAAANQISGQERYRLVYAGTTTAVRASNGLSLKLASVDALDRRAISMLFVPGGDAGPLQAALADDAYITAARTLAARSRRVCSVCSGAFVLGKAGLLDGRRAATHWRGLDRLRDWFPSADVDRSALYVEDGRIWSSAGVTAGIDMALALVERDLGRDVAMGVARELVLFLVRPGGQSQFSAPLDLQARAASTDLKDLPPWLEARLAEAVSVEEIADAMGLSERTLHRRCKAVFAMTPLELLITLRLEQARSLLSDPSVPLKTVAGLSGFFDLTALGKAFKARFGVTPGAYRQRFAGSAARLESR